MPNKRTASYRRHLCAFLLGTLVFTPALTLAQETDTNAARKAALENDKLAAEVMEKQLNNRAKQIEMARSTTTVEGTLVENNVAASKAIGCAAADIARILRGSYPLPTLVQYSPDAANGLSEYAAVLSQAERLNMNYQTRIDALKNAIEGQSAPPVASTERKNELENSLRDIENAIRRSQKGGLTTFSGEQVALMNQKANLQNELYKLDVSGAAAGVAATVNPIAGLVLSLAPLFKSDTQIKGTAISSTDAELFGYLYRFMSYGSNVKVVSPDSIMLDRSVAGTSKLLKELEDLSKHYKDGTGMINAADVRRKEIMAAAAIKHRKAVLETEVALQEKALADALDAYAANQNSAVLKARFEAAQRAREGAKAGLANAQKAIDQEGTKFDQAIVRERSALELMNSRADDLAKVLSGDKATAGKRLLGDHLRSEILFEKLNEPSGKKPSALWLDLDIAASGANQRKRSSLIVDLFRQGPDLSYSGGSVVTYRLIEGNGNIHSAGTVWAFTPYQKSKRTMEFQCRDSRDLRILYAPEKRKP